MVQRTKEGEMDALRGAVSDPRRLLALCWLLRSPFLTDLLLLPTSVNAGWDTANANRILALLTSSRQVPWSLGHRLAEQLWGVSSHHLPLPATVPLVVRTQMLLWPNGNGCSAIEKINTSGSPDFLGRDKESGDSLSAALAPAWALVMRRGCNNGAISLSSRSQSSFWPKLASLTLHQPPSLWVTSWAVRCMRSLKHRCFFSDETLLDGCWGDQQIHRDWPLWYFLKHWMLYLSPPVKLWGCHWDFQLYNCHFILWRNNKCLN